MKHATFTIAFAVGFVLLATPALAQDDYSGSVKASYVKQDALPIGDNQGHVIVLNNAKGVNKSTGKNDYFDDGEIVIQEHIDIVNGNGAQEGYITFSKGGERTVSKTSGKVVTVMAPDGKTPITTVEGTFEQVYGTNLYGTLKPVGTYKVKFLSPNDFIVDWVVIKFN